MMSRLLKLALLAVAIGHSLQTAAQPAQKANSLGSRDLLGGLIDSLTCVRTTNRGFKGRCVPRSCCTRSLGVDELCIDPDYTCCYGGDTCTGSGAIDRVHHDNHRPPHHPHNEFDEDRLVDSFDRRCVRQLVRRYEWNAAETRGRVRPMAMGMRHVIIHHTDDGEHPCWSFEECRRYLQRTQHRYQHSKGFPDIPWSFLIGENGEVFEGMGWGVEGYHTEGWNERSVGVAFIGDYDVQAPSRRAMEALRQLLYCGEQSGYIDRYYGVYGHRDMRDTECPGDLLYDEIRHLKAFQKLGRALDLGKLSATNSTTITTDSPSKP